MRPKDRAAKSREMRGRLSRAHATAPQVKASALKGSKFRRVMGVIAAIASVGAALGGLAGYWNAYQATRGAQGPLLASIGVSDAGPLSIAVLPLSNLSGDPSQDYVAEAMTIAMAADLSRIRDAYVVDARTAVGERIKSDTVRRLGTELGVRFALAGGVQRSKDKVRMTLQLIDTKSSNQLWADTFEEEQNDLFAIQDLITTRIGNSIGHELVVLAARRSQLQKTIPGVVDLMLRATAASYLPISIDNFRQQQSLYRRVLTQDPNMIQAMVGLAVALARPVDNGLVTDELQAERDLQEAYRLALKAKELDADVPDIYFVLSCYFGVRGDWPAAKRADEKALALDPKTPRRYNTLGVAYLNEGNALAAKKTLAKGIRIDPKHVAEHLLFNMGRAEYMLGNNRAAVDWLERAVEANPKWALSQAYMAVAYASVGEATKAKAAVAATAAADPTFKLVKFEAPTSGQAKSYVDYWKGKLIPDARAAGLPE